MPRVLEGSYGGRGGVLMIEVSLYSVPRINQSTYVENFWLAVHSWGVAVHSWGVRSTVEPYAQAYCRVLWANA